MLFPTEVGIGDKQVAVLAKFYKRAYKKILSEIEGATDFGIYNRKAILSQIEVTLKQLGVDVQAFIDYEIPHNYKVGADQAVRQLNSFGGGVVVDQGFNLIHQEAINALLDDTAKAFGESINGVRRHTQALLGNVVKEEIKLRMVEGVLSGESTREIKKYIVSLFKEEGLIALTDRAGKTWQLDTYTEMLIRTKSVEARNTGLINRSLENDNDLVQVSDHSGECELCRPWEGKILSITGRTKGYPTLLEAQTSGLFHPNCRHAINVYSDISSRTRSYNPNTGKYELDNK